MRRLQVVLVGALALVGVVLVPSATSAKLEPDVGFGSDGVMTVELLDQVGGITVDSEGRTLVVGMKNDTPDIGHVAVARYLEDGTPDTSFDGDGRVDLAAPAIGLGGSAIRVLTNGTVVVAAGRYGLNTTDQATTSAMFIAHLTTTGALDAGFGSGGQLTPTPPDQFRGTRSATIGPDGTTIFSVGVGLGFVGYQHEVVSPTGVQTEWSTIDDLPAGDGCFGSTQPAILSPIEFVSPTEVVYGIHSGLTFPTPACPYGETGSFVVRSTLTSDLVWVKRFADTYVTGNPVVIDDDILIRLDPTIFGGTRELFRMNLADGSPAAGWGVDGKVTLDIPQPEPPSIGDPMSFSVPVAEGGITMFNAYNPDDAAQASGILTTFTATGALDTETPQAVVQVSNGNIVGLLAPTPDGGAVWATTARLYDEEFNLITQPTELRRYRSDAPIPPAEADVETLTPARLLDTRPGSETVDGQFAGGPRPLASSVTKVRIAGRGGVPADASAAIVNLTVVLPDGPGFATIYPCTPTPPNASNINFLAGAFVANSVTAKLDANGDACIFTLTGADLLIDVNGYVPEGSDVGTLTPARLLDTRAGSETVDGQSAGGPRPTAGSVTKVRVAGRGGVPSDASAAIVNLTVVLPDGPGFATLFPCTPTPPNASNINFLAGAFVANSVAAKLDANGDVCIFTLTGADLLIDVNAYVGNGSDVGSLTPARLLDTRAGSETVDGQSAGGPRPAAGSVTKVRVAGRGGVPADATTAIVNLTVVLPDGPGFATVYPCTPTPPNASNINFLAGAFVANSVTAKLDGNGDLCIFTLTGADLLIDVSGYVASST
jgi:hypothetical protein